MGKKIIILQVLVHNLIYILAKFIILDNQFIPLEDGYDVQNYDEDFNTIQIKTDTRQIDHDYLVENTENVNPDRKRSHDSYKEWTPKATKMLIGLYKEHRNKVGSFDMKNLKVMFDRISKTMKEHNLDYSPANCTNRWKVLERKYKDFVDDQKQTGRGKKYFEYLEDMDEIFGRKTNLHPKILLTADTEIIGKTSTLCTKLGEVDNQITSERKEVNDNTSSQAEEGEGTSLQKKVGPLKTKVTWRTKRKTDESLITEVNKERKEYYRQKILYLQNMYEEKKRYHNERILLEKERIYAERKSH